MSSREITLNFTVRLPRWSRRQWCGIALVATLMAGAVAYAGVNWTPFTAGEKLSSATMNANFQAMADAITALQNATPVKTPLPHLINGGVDIGIYLGYHTLNVTGGGQFVYTAPVTYLPAIGGPYGLYQQAQLTTIAIYYDGVNCTGNAYVLSTSPSPTFPFANIGFNSTGGTVFQLTGQGAKAISLLSQAGLGMCNAMQPQLTAVYPAKDTKVPNIVLGGTSTVQLM